MRPIMGIANGMPVMADPTDLMLMDRMVRLDNDFIPLPGRRADTFYCLASLKFLDDNDQGKPIRLLINEAAELGEYSLELCQAMRTDIRSDIITIAQQAVGGPLLIVAAGTPGRRFVRPHGKYAIKLDELAPKLKKRLTEHEIMGETGEEESDPEDGDSNIAPIERIKIIKAHIENLNTRVITTLQEYGGKAALPVIERLVREEFVFLSADDMIRYGFADHKLTPETRQLCYGNGQKKDAPPARSGAIKKRA